MGIFKLACGLTMLMFVAVQGELLFQDDFSDPANSDSYWPAQKDLQINFGGGKCSITNTNANYAGLLTHTVNSKPTEFTYSASVTRSSDTIVAGLYVNSVSNAIDGFAVQLGAGSLIYVTKFGSGKSEIIFSKQSSSVNTTQSNNLMISKKSTSYYIYCNNEYVGSFTDSDISTVAVGLILSPKTSAVFDNVVLTNSVTLPPPPSSYCEDDFNDGKLTGWLSFGNQADISEADSVLKIKTKADSVVYLVRDFAASPVCTLKVEVSHRGGSSSPLYGLFLCGNPKDNVIPVAGFGITGSSYYGISLPGSTSIDLAQSSDIRGDAYISGSDTVYKKDTLKIIGSSGKYICFANGVCLDSFSISFPVTGVGVFCYGDLKVNFDNFYVDEAANSSVTHFVKNRISTLNQNVFSKGNLLVDPLGRSIRINGNFNKSRIASGLYLTNKKMAGKVLITR